MPISYFNDLLSMTIEKPSCLNDCKVVHPQKVVWGDMDSMNHVNNTKYFYYCETARIEFIKLLYPNFASNAPGDMNPVGSDMKTGLALAETSCRFKVPVTYPDTLLIGTVVSKIDDNQFFVKHSIYSEKLSLIAAEAEARMVHFDFEKGKRLAFDDDLIAILRDHLLA
jgi:acyl-CoA thioester hydrolase